MFHENIDMICMSLVNKTRLEKLETYYNIIANADLIWKATVCDIYIKDGVWWQCENCSSNSIEKLFPFKDANVITEYFQWETAMVKRNGKKDYQTTKKWWKPAAWQRWLFIYRIYLLILVSITIQISISFTIWNKQRRI